MYYYMESDDNCWHVNVINPEWNMSALGDVKK